MWTYLSRGIPKLQPYGPIIEVESFAEKVDANGRLVRIVERVIHKPGDMSSNIEGCNLDDDAPCYETGLTDALVAKQHDLCAL